jgi:hypothetical protein
MEANVPSQITEKAIQKSGKDYNILLTSIPYNLNLKHNMKTRTTTKKGIAKYVPLQGCVRITSYSSRMYTKCTREFEN